MAVLDIERSGRPVQRPGAVGVVGRALAVGLPSVVAFWAYLALAGAVGGSGGYLLAAPVAGAVALAGVRLARRLGLAGPWRVGLGTPALVATAALLGTLAGGGLNDAGGGWPESLGWALVALLTYPAVALVGAAASTSVRITAVASAALAYALLLGYVQVSLPRWRADYYRRHQVPMVAVEVPGFELNSARAYESELVIWLRGRAGQRYAGSYLRAEVHQGELAGPPCGTAAAVTVTAARWICPSDLIIGRGTTHWFRLAEPNGTDMFTEVLPSIAERAAMRPVTMAELVALPRATY